jgi:amidase
MMSPSEWESHDMTGLAALVQKGEIAPRELAETAIARIEALNPIVNAVVIRAFEESLDELSRRTDRPPFLGMPYLVKDLYAPVRGLPLTNGSRLFEKMTPDFDSTLISRLRAAGFVFPGRTNSPEFGLSASTEPYRYGPTRNPWNLEHIAGGSSGGAGAAVASGMVPVAHATDSAGSIRIPASCNGLVGLKPTRGLNPYGPHRGDAAHGISHENAVTRSVRDTAALLDITAGPDAGAPYFSLPPEGGFMANLTRAPASLKIGFTTETFAGRKVDPECAEGVLATARLLEELGHNVEELRPEFDVERMVDNMMTVLIGSLTPMINAWERQLGRRFGPDDVEPQAHGAFAKARSTDLDAYLTALAAMQLEVRKMGRFFQTHDILITPTLSSPPPRLGHLPTSISNVDEFMDRLFALCPFTAPFNASGQPAASLPLHWSSSGLPIGIQFVAGYGEDAKLLRLATQVEQAAPWFARRPLLAS